MKLSALQRYNVKVTGNGTKPMMLAHGLGCDQTMWEFIVPAFEADYKIVLFDYPGSGQSVVQPGDVENHQNLQSYADDIVEIVQELKLRDLIFAGHSVSGMIGMLAAIAQPDLFSKIIMISPSPCYLNQGAYQGGFHQHEIDELLAKLKQSLNQWTDEYAPVIMGNADRPELTEALSYRLKMNNREMLYEFAKHTFASDLRDELAKLTTPALIIQATNDVIAPMEVGRYMHQQMKNSKLEFIKAMGHCVHFSDPNGTISLMKDYLGEA